jgi:predicted P-loop ATPase
LGVEVEDSDSLTINARSVVDEILRRFLIGAVARAMQPGCDMPWMPVFVGA